MEIDNIQYTLQKNKDLQKQHKVSPVVWSRMLENNNIRSKYMQNIPKQISKKNLKIYWPNKIFNKELLERTKMERIEDNIKKRI